MTLSPMLLADPTNDFTILSSGRPEAAGSNCSRCKGLGVCCCEVLGVCDVRGLGTDVG